jgi:lysophospholipase
MHLVETPENPVPPLALVEELRAVDGIKLRTARWTPERPARGTVAVFGGRSEFIEKYFETIADLLKRGLVVVALDWRGQGGSERQLKNPRKGHIDDFSLYERDLNALVRQTLEPHCPKPWFGLCHSMGGAILLRIAEAGRCPFDRLVLSSPMIAISGLRAPKSIRGLVEGLDALG